MSTKRAFEERDRMLLRGDSDLFPPAECCYVCGNETGKAGRADDSFYGDDDDGPPYTKGKPMRILDLFCGAGGAAKGYSMAGFVVVGVDIKPQKTYPFEFHEADAMTYPLDGFDVIHASPPCQAYSQICRNMGTSSQHPDLVAKVRSRLMQSRANWIIENVVGSPLQFPVTLCGTMFGLKSKGGLWLRRHRGFETSWPILAPSCEHPKTPSIGVYGNGTNSHHRKRLGRNIRTEEQREAMGIDWMARKELSQAIPPAYTEWIGKQLLKWLNRS